MDITTWADRQGRATEFADAYSQSQLKQQNQQQLQKFLANEDSQVGLLSGMGHSSITSQNMSHSTIA